MSAVLRLHRPGTRISWAVATVSALAMFLVIASAAYGATESVVGGTTELTLTRGFEKKLGNHDVKVLSQGSGKVSDGTVQLSATGGELDLASGQGSIVHAGGFKLKHGKSKASIAAVSVNLGASAVFAKVANSRMKLGSLAPISTARKGLNVTLSSAKLQLTKGAAKRLNHKLGLSGVIKAGDAMSNAISVVQLRAQAKQETPPSQGGEKPAENRVVNVMTRNLYLGADLAPAIAAPNLKAFVAAAGGILREVTHNDFPTRAQSLAQEILEQEPDLVGLQEVALWRTASVNFEVLTNGPSATTVRYDYLQELMDDLNASGTHYEVVVVQPEFDLEAPADEDNNSGTGPEGADINGRLTMRDVILVKTGAGVETWNAKGANFKTLLPVPILGSPVLIKRGWTSADARVRGSRPFHFVNTHLEAFEAHIRAAQAGELIQPPGPATGSLPVILVGDLNSDDDTVAGEDQIAYGILQVAGLVERSTDEPLSCCLNASELGESDGGNVADFDHQVDHVMTNDPEDVQLLGSAVTGLDPVNGFWDSDHAGLFSSLEVSP
jgi:endonuclease/exonuclease/phosphatase family metal-dependent hydrolase